MCYKWDTLGIKKFQLLNSSFPPINLFSLILSVLFYLSLKSPNPLTLTLPLSIAGVTFYSLAVVGSSLTNVISLEPLSLPAHAYKKLDTHLPHLRRRAWFTDWVHLGFTYLKRQEKGFLIFHHRHNHY